VAGRRRALADGGRPGRFAEQTDRLYPGV